MNTTNNDNDSNNRCVSFIAKLRRLKIQECIIMNNVKNSLIKCSDYKENNSHNNDWELKIYSGNLKNSFIEIKNLFEDVKLKTDFQGTIEKYDFIDIEELKRDITELESKIKLFKQYIQNELRTLQYEETVIKEKTNKTKTKLKIHGKQTSKHYNDVVTSPVRVIINSPFKCVEVQRFQEFMKNSPNKYGGWNGYNHNVFIQIWKKYYGDARVQPSNSVESLSLMDFRNEVLSKTTGLKPEDVESHKKWYSEYLDLRNNQVTALNRWKENRRKIKHPLRVKKTEITDGGTDNPILCSKQNISSKETTERASSLNVELSRKSNTECKEVTKQRYMKPTKQWINKRNSIEEFTFRNSDINNITKLHTPTWRLNFKT